MKALEINSWIQQGLSDPRTRSPKVLIPRKVRSTYSRRHPPQTTSGDDDEICSRYSFSLTYLIRLYFGDLSNSADIHITTIANYLTYTLPHHGRFAQDLFLCLFIDCRKILIAWNSMYDIIINYLQVHNAKDSSLFIEWQ